MLTAGLGQHPFAEFADQAARFGNRNEHRRADRFLVVIGKAHQGFGADHLAGPDVDHRLVVQAQAAPAQCVLEPCLDRQRLVGAAIQLRRVELVTAATRLLCLVHRQVGGVDQCADIGGVAGEQADADRR